MAKRLSMFPMTRNLCAAARHPSLLQGYVFVDLMIPSFTGLEGQDISRVDGGDPANTLLVTYEASKLANCDVLMMDYEENWTDITAYRQVMEQAQTMGKEVVLSHALARQLKAEQATPLTWPGELPMQEDNDGDRLYEIRVPVIMVLGQGSRTDNFAVELALRSYFIEMGYTVSQIGSHAASTFFGFGTLPDFLYEPRDAYEKTLKFNRYAKEMTLREKSHLLIVGVPDSITKYNDRLLFGMGYIPQSVCNAVKCDEAILCLYHIGFNKMYLDELAQLCKYHLNAPTQFFNVANTWIKTEPPGAGNLEWSYVETSSAQVLRYLDKEDCGEYHMFNVLNSTSAHKACIAMKQVLTDNVSAIR